MVDIFRAAKRRGKYPPLFNDMVIARSIFVVRIHVYPAIYVILCVAEKNGIFPAFFFPINVENCALSSMC